MNIPRARYQHSVEPRPVPLLDVLCCIAIGLVTLWFVFPALEMVWADASAFIATVVGR